jgi:hypothetical protein
LHRHISTAIVLLHQGSTVKLDNRIETLELPADMADRQRRQTPAAPAVNYDNFVIERRRSCGQRRGDRKISSVNRGVASLPCQDPGGLAEGEEAR